MKGVCRTESLVAFAALFLSPGATAYATQATLRYHSPAFSADGSRVVFACDASTDDVYELFSSPIDPAAPAVQLNAPFVAGGDVQEYPPLVVSSTGRVVYVADALVDGVNELFSVPVDGSLAPVRLSLGDAVQAFEVSPTGTTVVFRRNDRLYGRAIDGSGPVALLRTPFNHPVYADCISPDGTHVVYLSQRPGPYPYQLWSQPIDASADPTWLADVSLAVNWGIEDEEMAVALQFTSDGQHAMFTESYTTGARYRRTVPVDGSLSDEPIPYFGSLSPEGTSLVFGRNGPALFEMSAAGGPARPLCLPNCFEMLPGSRGYRSPHRVYFSPDGNWVVCTVVDESFHFLGLYSVPRAGAPRPTRLTGPGWFDNVLSTAANRVVFGSGNPFVIESIPIAGGVPPVALGRVDMSLITGGGSAVGVSLDGETLVFAGYPTGGSSSDLYAVPTDGLGLPVLLDGLAVFARFNGVWIRNGFAVYRRGDLLYGVPLDASAPALLYHD